MTEIAGQIGARGAATAIVHESYSFACMRCGHGWEQSYEIEHHLNAEGHEFVMYVAEGQVVPSPLSRPTCQNCDGHVVRIMRPGQVTSARNSMHHATPHQRRRSAEPATPVDEAAAPPEAEGHHWHLSDLLHPFSHRKAS